MRWTLINDLSHSNGKNSKFFANSSLRNTLFDLSNSSLTLFLSIYKYLCDATAKRIAFKCTYQLGSESVFLFRQFQWQWTRIDNLPIFLFILIIVQWILLGWNACNREFPNSYWSYSLNAWIAQNSHVLVIHPSVSGTPTKLSLNVRFSSELANLSTASSRGSSDFILSLRIGSSSHLLNCSYTSSNSELKSVESS